ncbi:putative glycosidase crf1 [Trichoderma ghanense]|uniref:Glycosidase crf1 n=1 Tax=Trichoderma ghanense TaxID=65468 RepID=A0ABY2HI11_9HYPO
MLLRFLLLLSNPLALPVLASLKDLSHCDPLKKDAHCPPDPAFATETSFDFTRTSWDDDGFTSFWTADSSTTQDKRQLALNNIDGRGAAFTVWQDGQAPTLTSNKYLLFGKVSVQVQAAKGPGLITAIVLKSDSGDEIDWELLGAYENQAQTNYFYDGQPLFNTYNTTHHLDASSFARPHKYAIEWTPSNLTFSIDDVVRKTWHSSSDFDSADPGSSVIPASKWPQTPMQLKLGIWSVSNASDPGTVSWAGGLPDWSGREAAKDPYAARFLSIQLQDYAGGCNETDGSGIEYLYDERTAGWQGIDLKGCANRAAPGEYPPLPPPLTTSSGGSFSSSSSSPQPTQSEQSAFPTETATNGGGEGRPTQATGDQNPDPSEASGSDDSGNAALPSGRPSSPLGAVVFLLWLLAV